MSILMVTMCSKQSNQHQFCFFENHENWIKKQTSYAIFFIRCHDCSKNKILHIVHLKNQHWMNRASPVDGYTL
jgi:hypothetical protein